MWYINMWYINMWYKYCCNSSIVHGPAVTLHAYYFLIWYMVETKVFRIATLFFAALVIGQIWPTLWHHSKIIFYSTQFYIFGISKCAPLWLPMYCMGTVYYPIILVYYPIILVYYPIILVYYIAANFNYVVNGNILYLKYFEHHGFHMAFKWT